MRETFQARAFLLLQLAGIPMLLSSGGEARAQGAQSTSARAGTIEPNRVVGLRLGGPSVVEQERRYALRLARGQSVIVDLLPTNPIPFRPRAPSGPSTRPALRPFLEIHSPTGEIVARAPSAESRPAPRALSIESTVGDFGVRAAFFPLSTGMYTVRVGYESADPAAFELLVRPRALPAPPREIAVSLGQSLSDQKLEGDTPLHFSFEAPAAGQWIVIDMRSEELDSMLELRGPGGSDAPLIAEDDDSGGGNSGNARIVARLPARGKYTIISRSFLSEGKFDLNLAEYVQPRLEPTILTVGVNRGEFDGVNQVVALGRATVGYKLYALSGEAGQRFSVAMRSEDIDSILQVGVPAIASDDDSPQDLAIVAENDDHREEEGVDSRLHIRFNQKGQVLVRAGSADEMNPRGAFTITVTELPSAQR
jgi:hypothetical protein